MKILLALDPRLTARRGGRIDEYHPEVLLRELECAVRRVTSREELFACYQESRRRVSRFDVVLTDGMMTDQDGFGIAVTYDQPMFARSLIRGMGVCVPKHLARVMPDRVVVLGQRVVMYTQHRVLPNGEPNWPGLLTDVCRQLRRYQ